jgi:hypothetical protein
MKTAITTAETWDGKEVLLAGRKVPLPTQRTEFNNLRCLYPQVHADFSAVIYQEEDGRPERLTFVQLVPPAVVVAPEPVIEQTETQSQPRKKSK